MVFLHFDPNTMDAKKTKSLLDKNTHFGRLMGRVMKIGLGKPAVADAHGAMWLQLDCWGYDRDNGQGSALGALEASGHKSRIEPDPPKPKNKNPSMQTHHAFPKQAPFLFQLNSSFHSHDMMMRLPMLKSLLMALVLSGTDKLRCPHMRYCASDGLPK